MPDAEFETRFQSFIRGCEEIIKTNHGQVCPNLRSSWLEIHHGNRYIRILKCDDWNKEALIASGITDPAKHIGRRAHVFVDKTNGDVLRAASYKKPETKHPRGNIFDESGGLRYMTPYGAMYLDQMSSVRSDGN